MNENDPLVDFLTWLYDRGTLYSGQTSTYETAAISARLNQVPTFKSSETNRPEAERIARALRGKPQTFGECLFRD